MKNIGLISWLMLAIIALSHNLSAGPVCAYKLTRNTQAGEQTVLLYGDRHDTEVENENRERQAIDAFCAELKQADNQSLMLCEYNLEPLSTIFSETELQTLYPQNCKKFMPSVCDFSLRAHESGFQIKAKNIESRVEISGLIKMAFKYIYASIKNPSDAETLLEKKAYEAIKHRSLKEIFQKPSNNLKDLSTTVSDSQVKIVLEEVASLLEQRKELYWKTISAKTGITVDELNHVTIDIIKSRMTSDIKYETLAKYLSNVILMNNFFPEVIEAEALRLIAGVQNPYKKIILVAGAKHIWALEKYLSRLGFQQKTIFGQDYRKAAQEEVYAQYAFWNAIDAGRSSRIFPLDPFDQFGQSLFCDELDNACQRFLNTPWFDRSINEQEACEILGAKQKAFDQLKPISLVPYDTFKWINECS